MPLWNREPEHLVKLVLVGDAGIGKTSFLLRFVENKFDTNPSTVAVDFKLTTFKVNGSYIKLQIWDTAGQERFRTISSAYYRGAHGVLLMYDTTSSQSFANLSHWAREVNQHCTDAVNVVLLANKCDLNEQRVVTRERMEELAEGRGWKYFETSGKTGTNVQQAIRSLVNQVVKNRAYSAQFASLRGTSAGLGMGSGSGIAVASSPSLSAILSSPSFGTKRSSSSSEHLPEDSLESSLLESGCNPAARVVMGSPRVRAGRAPVEGTIRLEAYDKHTPTPGSSSCCSGSSPAFEHNPPVRSRSAQSLGLGRGIEVEWEPDSASPCCRNCDQPFTAVRRRHHCRWCGKLFCKYCCHNKLPRDELPVTLIPNAADVKRGLSSKCRICNTCFQWVASVAAKNSTAEAPATGTASGSPSAWAPGVARTVSADLTIDEQLQIRSQFKRDISQKFR